MLNKWTKKGKVGMIFLIILGLLSSLVWARESPEDSLVYRKFLTVLGAEAQYQQMLKIMMDQLQQGFVAETKQAINKNKNLSAEKKEEMQRVIEEGMKRFTQRTIQAINEIMPFEDLVKNVYYPALAKYFTVAEIQGIIAFFESPLGKKYVLTEPLLMQEAIQLVNELYYPKLLETFKNLYEEELASIEKAIQELDRSK